MRARATRAADSSRDPQLAFMTVPLYSQPLPGGRSIHGAACQRHQRIVPLLVVALAALLADRGDDFTLALTALAVAVALVVLVESIRFWVSSGAPAVHDEGETA